MAVDRCAAPAGAHGWRRAWTLRSSTVSGLRCPQGAANAIFVLATISDANSRWPLPRRRTNAKQSAPRALAQLRTRRNGYRQPCPVGAAAVQRVVRPENETNYCATSQTGRRLLAGRSLSRLLRDTHPKRMEDLE